jgi:hypothetical protein
MESINDRMSTSQSQDISLQRLRPRSRLPHEGIARRWIILAGADEW